MLIIPGITNLEFTIFKMEIINSTVNFIRDLYSQHKGLIPLHEPRFGGNEKKYLNESIDSTFVSSVGPFVDRFERDISEIAGTSHAVAVVNGTAALQVGLRLVGVENGDEVLTQALTFVATINAIIYNGASPIFIDVDLDTMGLSPRAISDFLEEFGELRSDVCYNKRTNKRIAACVPMHTFGFPVHLNELLAICSKWHIPVLEDSAESLGSKYHGKSTGSFGKVGVFSFNGNKIVTSGGGGALVTNEKGIYDKGKYLTTTAKRPHPYEYFHEEVGYNFRMPNLNAALACAQLEQLEDFLKNKRALACEYMSFFKHSEIKFREELGDTEANYWLMCVELENKVERDYFLKFTNDSNVMTRPIWQLMYRLPMFMHFQRDQQQNASYLEERIVNIPSSVRY
jgi:perosamine synthetase